MASAFFSVEFIVEIIIGIFSVRVRTFIVFLCLNFSPEDCVMFFALSRIPISYGSREYWIDFIDVS